MRKPDWLPELSLQVWLLFLGRLLSQVGTGFTLFYIPIFFVEQVGFSATEVGLGLGAMAVSGVIGRIAGGSLADTIWGRKPTLLFSLVVSALGSLMLAGSTTYLLFVVANLINGLGQGFYWPAAETMIADLTTRQQRNQAFGLTRLGDNLGLSIGVALAGVLIATTAAYRLLFVIDAVTFLIFAGVVVVLVSETRPANFVSQGIISGWRAALTDRALLIFIVPNILFTTYVSQISSSLPLFFSQFLHFPAPIISILFALHGIGIALIQLPVAHWLNHIGQIQALRYVAGSWGIGFVLIGIMGLISQSWQGGLIVISLLGLSWFSLAIVIYNPSATSLVVDLASSDLRGIYLSVHALCWAGGFALGPFVGGIMLDRPLMQANGLWLIWIGSLGIVLLLLNVLDRMMPELKDHAENPEREAEG